MKKKLEKLETAVSKAYSKSLDSRSGNILSFLLPLFQEWQLSVTGKSMCTKYCLTLRRAKPAQEKCPDMTLDVYRGRKTTMQQQLSQGQESSPDSALPIT